MSVFQFVLVIVGLLIPLGQSSTSTASDDAIRSLVSKYVDARERVDPKAVEVLFTADADQLVDSAKPSLMIGAGKLPEDIDARPGGARDESGQNALAEDRASQKPERRDMNQAWQRPQKRASPSAARRRERSQVKALKRSGKSGPIREVINQTEQQQRSGYAGV